MTTALSAGISLKPPYYEEALATASAGLWFEIHPENYFVDGGPRLAWLDAIRKKHPLSLHGVSLSLAADRPPLAAHLSRLASLVRRIEPALVSEHLAWSGWGDIYHPDLLPFPRTNASLARIADNIDATQEALGVAIAIENPAHYLHLPGHDWEEIDFMEALVRRTGCRLLVDVNNILVGANNLGTSAEQYIDRLQAASIAEIHLAGFSADPHLGERLLIDSHDQSVAPQVWNLYQRLISRIGPCPTLIERDGNLPAFSELVAERDRAEGMLQMASREIRQEA